MSNESSLNVESVNPEPQVKIIETNNNGKYTYEQFKADLEKVQRGEDVSINQSNEIKQDKIDEPVNDVDETRETESQPVEELEFPQTTATEQLADDDDDEIFKGPIPKKRLNKEIEKRRALEEQLAQEREARIKFETELNMYNEALKQLQQKPVEELPLDPIDNDAHRYYEKRINELEAKLDQKARNIEHNQAQVNFRTALAQQEADFMRKTPDFDKAFEHVVNTEVQNLMNVGVSEKEARQATNERLTALAAKALESGKDVPSIFYNVAKNYGYQAQRQTKTGPNLEKIAKNMTKSETILNDVPEISTTLVPDGYQYTTADGFMRLMNKDGKGVNANAFQEALAKIRNSR